MEPSTGSQGSPAVFMDGNRLAIEFVRRRSETNPQINYRAVFSDSLNPENEWKESGTTTISPIDDSWERVKVVDTVSMNSAKARFARVEIEWEKIDP